MGMLYVTYTEQNMSDFLTYDRTHEVVVVAPVYNQLRSSMTLDKEVAVEQPDMDGKLFNTKYLLKNKPVLVD
jgi:hypothetical protein